MSETLDFLRWVFSMNPATAFVIVVVATFAVLGLWHAYRAWLRRRDERQWSEGYHSGILAGRRQERGEVAADAGMATVVSFYNSLDVPVIWVKREERR